MKCVSLLRPHLHARRALAMQTRLFGVTVTQSSGSGSRPPHTSSLIEAGAALELVRGALQAKTVQFVDASWFMGDTGRGLQSFQAERIPGAVFFDIDQVAAPPLPQPLPHMLPSPEDFGRHMTALGVSRSAALVVYNQPGCVSAARCWWTFNAFGHPMPVYVLNGGLKAWIEAGGEVEKGGGGSSSSGGAEAYLVSSPPSPKLLADKQAVLHAMSTGQRQLCDARSEDRFYGRVEEPRAGLEGGHMPGALRLSFSQVLDPADSTRFRGFREIRGVFEQAGVVDGSEVIFTCGSGVTAAVLALARNHIGADVGLSAVYDGSWSEWGSDPSTPKMKE